jgi:Flp pilus assembly protein TadD
MQSGPDAQIRSMLFAALAAAALMLAAHQSYAADTNDAPPTRPAAAQPDNMTSARKLIQDRQWKQASTLLERVVAQEPANADAHNLLGYSYRWQDRMDESFASYTKALQIEPQHRGALNYMGIAYLKVGKPDMAEQHLARLQQICGAAGCEESRELAAKLAEYRAAKH